MTLRNKTILIISVTLTGLIAIVYLVARLFLLGRFVAMEEAAVRQNVARAQNLLNRNLDTMHALAVDWAYWDDTLTFVQDKNPAYIASNLPNTTLTNLQLHFMVFANTDGEIVYSKWVNLETGQEAPLPE
ncbi:MAG: response regulator receiver protein, partial [Caldilineae bacterium]